VKLPGRREAQAVHRCLLDTLLLLGSHLNTILSTPGPILPGTPDLVHRVVPNQENGSLANGEAFYHLEMNLNLFYLGLSVSICG
jgi:hypothetical protein